MNSPLVRVKALIWAQSLIGAVLLVGYFAVLAKGPDQRLAAVIIVCDLVWIAALRPLGRVASRLRPGDLVPPSGLPRWILVLCAVAQIGGLAAGRTGHDGLLACGHVVVLVTLLVRESISAAWEIPMHRKSWGICLLLVGFGLLRSLVCCVLDTVYSV